MALIELDFRSQALGYHEELMVMLPDRAPDKPYPVLWAFHGAGGDCSEWLRFSSLERYAAKRGLAVVLPTVSNGHGMDMAHGMKYFTMLSKELPAFLHYTFPCLSDRREDNFTAGASMGGYVAFKLALNYPDKFCAAGAFGGALDIVNIVGGTAGDNLKPNLFSNAFGSADAIRHTESDIIWLAEQLSREGRCPRLWSVVGDQDFGFGQVRGACEKFRAVGADLTALYEKGTHSFDLWDNCIEPFFDWLGLGKGEN